jgi:ribonuclease HI
MIAWRIWYARNEVMHEKPLPAIEGSRRFICSYMLSLDNIRNLTSEQIIKGKQVVGQVSPLTQCRTADIPHALWTPPQADELKLNVDGAFMVQTKQAGAGTILHRSDGSVVFSACRVLWRCSSALEAELMACLEGIRLATDMGHQQIVVETDCQELVLIATNEERNGSPLGHLIEDLRLLLASAHIVGFNKIPRVCNIASHELARFGMVNSRSQVWLGSVPCELRETISKDCNNSIPI